MEIEKIDKAIKIKCLPQVIRKTLNEFRVVSDQRKTVQENDLLYTKLDWTIENCISLNVTKNKLFFVSEYVECIE